jgi:hypothetical protein
MSVAAATRILSDTMGTCLDRDALEKLRETKRSRTSFRLASSEAVEYEFEKFGGPSTHAYVRFECTPADDLSFEVRASWPPTVPDGYDTKLELAVAEGVADVLLGDIYQHSGCAVVLVEVRYDEIGATQAAFMRAAMAAMRNLLSRKWTPVPRTAESQPSQMA